MLVWLAAEESSVPLNAGQRIGGKIMNKDLACKCDCPESRHGDIDYDGDSEGFAACDRPCEDCGCANFWRAE